MTNRRHRLLAVLVAVLAVGLMPARAEGRAAAMSAPAAASVTAQACTLTPTSGTEQRTLAAYPTRPYRVRVPAGLSGQVPLLLSLHGWSAISVTPALDNENNSGLDEFATRAHAIVVYPSGSWVSFPGSGGPTIYLGWNYWDAASPDIAYLRAVVAQIKADYCVDPHHVHADGISMGGLMSERLLCDAGDVFGSTSGHATNDVREPWVNDPTQPGGTSAPCNPGPHAAFWLSCSGNDPAVGALCDGTARPRWRDRLGCTNPDPAPVTIPYGKFRDYTCNPGQDFGWRVWDGLGHAYPQQYSSPVDVARRDRWIAELTLFYATHPLP